MLSESGKNSGSIPDPDPHQKLPKGPILHPSFMEISCVVFVWSCSQTNKQMESPLSVFILSVCVYVKNEMREKCPRMCTCVCISFTPSHLCMCACLTLPAAHWPGHPRGELHLVQAVPVPCDRPRPAVSAALQRLQASQTTGHIPG